MKIKYTHVLVVTAALTTLGVFPLAGNQVGATGFSPPSLLGVSIGAPYLHAGNARTLEALFSDPFGSHHRALSANFLNGADADARRLELIHFLLSIDDATALTTMPAAGAAGGKVCAPPF